ncbi:hypothetical protein B7R21_15920 [Subtercola boreus]|uniref:Uncharacterized protein n=1 Tax=Subtercola boreus TaxID=120213 RepID=A0A3E0VCN6_9MICO|nr:hypothetical protein [Subtercola boreus]RFA07656.1 hypothetical protein B7R21_15920 [Subtercola boreus]
MTIQHTPNSLPSDSDYARMKVDLFTTITVRERARTKKHRLAALGIAGALALGTTAGALVIAQASQGQINYTAECYGAADLTSTHFTTLYLPGDQTTEQATPLAERTALAIDQCSASWVVGTFEQDRANIPAGKMFPTPLLIACQLPDHRLGVFPSTEPAQVVCARLGLSTPRN